MNNATIQRYSHDEENPYVLISHKMLRDKSISPSAKCILCYLLCLPDHGEINHSSLMEDLNIDKECLNLAIAELINAGYYSETLQAV